MRFFELDTEQAKLIQRDEVCFKGNPIHSYPRSLALSQDGRWAVFNSQSAPDLRHDMIHLVRVDQENFTLEYMTGYEFEVDHLLAGMGFAPLPGDAAAQGWASYE